MKFQWQMKRTEIDESSSELPETTSQLQRVRALLRQDKHAEAVRILPKIVFEFNLDSCDSNWRDIFLQDGITVDVKEEDISIGLINDTMVLTINVYFDLPTISGISSMEVSEWLDQNGGWFAGGAVADWEYGGGDGGHLIVIQQ